MDELSVEYNFFLNTPCQNIGMSYIVRKCQSKTIL